MSKIETHMRNDTERRILRVLDYIHSNPTGDLSLDALADVAAMSRFHWHRVFRAVTGETAAQSVRRMRLNRASVALIESSISVADVAKSVGYPNPKSFQRVFTEHFGITPLAFRARGVLKPQIKPSTTGVDMTTYPIEISNEPARRLAAMSHTGPYPKIDQAFEKLSGIIGARGLFDQTRGMVGVFYDDPSAVAPDQLSSHAGFEVPDDLSIDPPLETVELSAGRHAVLTYKGPYTGLPAAYDQLYCNWLPTSGDTPADRPSFEVYQNSPMDTAPDDLVTKLYLPLA